MRPQIASWEGGDGRVQQEVAHRQGQAECLQEVYRPMTSMPLWVMTTGDGHGHPRRVGGDILPATGIHICSSIELFLVLGGDYLCGLKFSVHRG